MKIKVLIVEDEVLVADDLASDLEAYGMEVVDSVLSGEECLQSVTINPPHVVLMDIHLKGDMDGIATVAELKKHFDFPVIYLTANSDQVTVTNALETLPSSFITKPYNKRDLIIAIELAFEKYNRTLLERAVQPGPTDSIFVKKGTEYIKLPLSEVVYLEASGSYSTIITEGDQSYTVSNNLAHFQRQVNQPAFMKVHRSYVVNLEKVTGFDHHQVRLGKHSVPVSQSYHHIFRQFKKL